MDDAHLLTGERNSSARGMGIVHQGTNLHRYYHTVNREVAWIFRQQGLQVISVGTDFELQSFFNMTIFCMCYLYLGIFSFTFDTFHRWQLTWKNSLGYSRLVTLSRHGSFYLIHVKLFVLFYGRVMSSSTFVAIFAQKSFYFFSLW